MFHFLFNQECGQTTEGIKKRLPALTQPGVKQMSELSADVGVEGRGRLLIEGEPLSV
jgi:hypothetical protein